MSDQTKRRENPPEPQTNVYSFLTNLTNKFFNLVDSGNLIGAFVFFFCTWIFYVTSRIPEEDVIPLIRDIGSFLKSEGFYFFPLTISLLLSLLGNFLQYKIYKSEINRLSKVRNDLKYGLKDSSLKQLNEHHTSDFNLDHGGD